MTFINKIPGWLRWILFLPVALIAAIIVYTPFGLTALIVKHISPYKEITLFTRYLVDIVGYFLQGYIFVWLGSIIAPSHKFNISIILVFLVMVICIDVINRNALVSPHLPMMACSCEIIGAIVACYNTWRRYLKNRNELLTSS